MVQQIPISTNSTLLQDRQTRLAQSQFLRADGGPVTEPTFWHYDYAPTDLCRHTSRSAVFPMTELTHLTLTDVVSAMKQKRASAVEVMEATLARIDKLQPALNCFISIEPEDASGGSGQG